MKTGLMWFRRDLRLHDNTALHAALSECDRVHACFIFDEEILSKLKDRDDRRVDFIHQSIVELDGELQKAGAGLIVRQGKPVDCISRLADELSVDAVYANHDYEPRRLKRDASVRKALEEDDRRLHTFKDHVVFEKGEVLNSSDAPFRVYSQYRNAWRKLLDDEALEERSISRLRKRLARPKPGTGKIPSLEKIGFTPTDLQWSGGAKAARKMLDDFLSRIQDYSKQRDLPGVEGTSRLSVHLRFGTISVREVLREALAHGSKGAEKWVDEVIWRDFYNMILHHFPQTEHEAFQEKFRELPWREDKAGFEAWCEGRTGYPIVDAGMRQLNSTGYMHNRLRMITASFLTKHLRINWKWGERYFARRLLDYDLSQNLGGWQWSASIGTDAQPYFRIFNPILQSKRYDAEGDYIRQYVTELAEIPTENIHEPWEMPPMEQEAVGCVIGRDYPAPMVEHSEAREAALAMFKKASGK